MSTRPEFVWVFDPNRRVYRPPGPGEIWGKGGPIWREHWVKRRVIGETRVSWLLSGPQDKVPKKGGPGVCFSEAELNRLAWVHDNRHRIAEAIKDCSVEQLDQVAATIGYTPRLPGAV